ncbi:xylulokinase [Thetidibacter halocola]|uniref:Xylulose kinase n=1 Tax=Thetidibacter halocola TaxID=2827239 RepID=A0A8J7WGN3_9RHOB|nr:xylulokinase [Thetidibacter halocola]MBS0124973.1 xylulokinase [Thetidibacter halocola]
MFLGIDVGTSSVKAVLCDAALRTLSEASVPLGIAHPHPAWAEQHPDSWWQAAVQAVRALRISGPVRAIGLSGQMHGAVLLDASGDVLRPAILWNDGRAATDSAELSDPVLERIAGVRAMPGLTAPKLLWLRRHEPELHARIAHVLLPKDFIGHRLHGRIVTDRSDAGGTWWFDQARGTWSDRLCAATATDPAWLPEVLAGDAVAGTLTSDAAQALGLPAGIPVAAGAGDAVAGAVAIGAVSDGVGFISLGTSGQLFVATGAYAAAPAQGLHSFAHAYPGLWYQMAAMLNGARPMAWFSEMTGAPLPVLLAEAAEADSRDAPLCLPYLTGERTPHGDAQIRGAFSGIGNGTTRGQMMRAVIDAIAYSFADAKAAVEAARPLPARLRVIGGGARADLLVQTIADVMCVPLDRTPDAAVGPALGAARLAARAVGSEPPYETPEAQHFTPRDTPWHAERLAKFRALYQALKGLT